MFASTAHVILLLCVRRSAPGGVEAPSRPGHWEPDARSSGCFTWTPVGSLRSPGDPSCAFAPLLDPGRTDVPLPWRSHRCCPRLLSQRRLRTMRISGLAHAASAPALLRFAFRVAIHAQGWLPPGWLAFTERVSNPLDNYERFQITWSSPFPVLLTLDSCRADPTLVTAALGPGCVKTQSDLVVMPRGVRPTSFTMVLQRPESQRGQAWSRDQNRSLRDQGRRPAGDRRLTEPEFRQ